MQHQKNFPFLSFLLSLPVVSRFSVFLCSDSLCLYDHIGPEERVGGPLTLADEDADQVCFHLPHPLPEGSAGTMRALQCLAPVLLG